MCFKSLVNYLVLALVASFLGACGNQSEQVSLAIADGINNNNGGSTIEQPQQRDPIQEFAPEICSTLDFEGVTWPTDYAEMDQMAFSLAMNITGSFEGHNGWTNLSNNFDGQGFSMGILNQNLGQGSIQPLLIRMRDYHREVLENAMTESMLKSMLGMLADWEKRSTSPKSLSFAPMHEPERVLMVSHEEGREKKYGFAGVQTFSNKASVAWAKRTLYSDSRGRKFKPAWRKALKTIAGDPDYVSLQIEAAQYIHDRAVGYFERVKWTQIRAYLFLFDIVTQNGSLREKHFDKYAQWLKKNPQATEEEMMLEMLEIRVVDSNPKWQEDVRRRKRTIILGTGFVHGEDRHLPVEYCYDPIMSYEP